jgi:hypothetical protein
MDTPPPSSAVPDDFSRRPQGRHPLEIIPFFQQFPRSELRNVVYTLIWNFLFAVFFTLLSLLVHTRIAGARTFGTCMLIANCIGFLIHFAFALPVAGSMFGGRARARA